MIPTAGLYDTIHSWDMKIQLGDGVKMTFKAGGISGPDSTKFIGPDGWISISRGISAQPKSLLTSAIGPNDVHLVDSPNHCQSFLDAIKSRKPPVSPLDQAVRSDRICQGRISRGDLRGAIQGIQSRDVRRRSNQKESRGVCSEAIRKG